MHILGGSIIQTLTERIIKLETLCLHSLFLVLWSECLCLPPQDSYVEVLTTSHWYLEVGHLSFN